MSNTKTKPTKTINARVQNKYAPQTDWETATRNGFIPLKGEIIAVDTNLYTDAEKTGIAEAKSPTIYIGDGISSLDQLKPVGNYKFIKQEGSIVTIEVDEDLNVSISTPGIQRDADETITINERVAIDASGNVVVSANFETSGDVRISGDLIVAGEGIESNLENVVTPENTLTLRHDASVALGTDEYTGLIAENYDGENTGMLVFDNTGTAYVGDEGSLQPLATRDLTEDKVIPVWDEARQTLVNSPIKHSGDEVNVSTNMSISDDLGVLGDIFSFGQLFVSGSDNTFSSDQTNKMHTTIFGTNNDISGQYNNAFGDHNILTQTGYPDASHNPYPGAVMENDFEKIGTTGIFNTAIGYRNIMHGSFGLAIGRDNEIKDCEHGVALGRECKIYKDANFDEYMLPFTNTPSPSIADPIAGGWRSIATRNNAVALGQACVAHGSQGLAFGQCAVVDYDAEAAISMGAHTVATVPGQVVVGKANILDDTKIFIIGNGSFHATGSPGTGSDSATHVAEMHENFKDFHVERSNAFTIDINGNGEFAGGVFANHATARIGDFSEHVVTDKVYSNFGTFTDELSAYRVHSSEAVTIGAGKVNACYGIASGTANENELGSLKDVLKYSPIPISAPEVKADMGIAMGTGSKAESIATTAIGIGNTAGIRGMYWRDIEIANDGTAQISIVTDQTASRNDCKISASNLESDYGWSVGDYISIINENKYPFCAKITQITDKSWSSVSTATITVDASPFGADAYNIIEELMLGPDDKSIFAVQRIYPSTINGKEVEVATIVPRGGAIQLGWGAQTFGAGNIGAGMFSFSGGFANLQAGDFGAVFGRDNVGGYATFTAGRANINTKADAATFGRNNTVNSECAVVGGHSNKVKRNNAAVFGYNNSAEAASTLIAGDGNIANVFTQAVVGRYCDTSETGAALFVVGNGEDADNRSNAFLVHTNGTITASMIRTARNNTISGLNSATIGENNTISKPNSAAIGKNNKISGQQNLIAGSDNQCINNNSLVVGKWNKNTTSGNGSQSLMVGMGLTMGSQTQTVLGQYNQARTSKVLVIGWGTGNDSTGEATEAKTICTVNKTSKLNTNSAVNGGAMSNKQYYSIPATPSDVITYGWLMNEYQGGSGGGASFPTTAADGSELQDGAILVYRNGQWVAENPPTSVYTGEVK